MTEEERAARDIRVRKKKNERRQRNCVNDSIQVRFNDKRQPVVSWSEWENQIRTDHEVHLNDFAKHANTYPPGLKKNILLGWIPAVEDAIQKIYGKKK